MVFSRNSSDSNSPCDDETLVKRAVSDPEHFAMLYDRYIDLVYCYCYSRLGSVVAAEDATSTTFFNALSALRSFNPEIKPFRSWIFGIAHNAVIDQQRGILRRREAGFDVALTMADFSLQPEDEVISADESNRLRRAVQTLPVDQERVITLRLAGMSGEEIAMALGRRPGAIRAMQHRAIRRLRTLLNQGNEPISGKARTNDE